MRMVYGLLAAITLWLGQVAIAQAQNPPFLQGKYAFVSTEICEANFTFGTTGLNNATKDLAQKYAGSMSMTTGYITFTPTGDATGGTFSLTSTVIGGGALRMNISGSTWASAPFGNSGTYAATATTFTLNGQAYTMTFSSVSSNTGLANTINLIYMDPTSPDGNLDCVVNTTATRRQFTQ
jgi:hypothetical protein